LRYAGVMVTSLLIIKLSLTFELSCALGSVVGAFDVLMVQISFCLKVGWLILITWFPNRFCTVDFSNLFMAIYDQTL
jgi:hypothetical protein